MGGSARTVITDTTPAFLGSALSTSFDGFTLIRTRGELLIQMALSTSARDAMAGAFGIGIATAAAVAIGVTALPTPITEQGSENWIYWTAFSVNCPQIGTDAANGLSGSAVSSTFRATVDSKAMRKFNSEDALYAIIEVGTETGVVEIDAYFDSRMLFKIP